VRFIFLRGGCPNDAYELKLVPTFSGAKYLYIAISGIGSFSVLNFTDQQKTRSLMRAKKDLYPGSFGSTSPKRSGS
jgi:hypothetical protein